MVKKWVKPRGKSFVLMEEDEIDIMLKQYLVKDEPKKTKVKKSKEEK